jgi:hypothetical protein
VTRLPAEDEWVKLRKDLFFQQQSEEKNQDNGEGDRKYYWTTPASTWRQES